MMIITSNIRKRFNKNILDIGTIRHRFKIDKRTFTAIAPPIPIPNFDLEFIKQNNIKIFDLIIK